RGIVVYLMGMFYKTLLGIIGKSFFDFNLCYITGSFMGSARMENRTVKIQFVINKGITSMMVVTARADYPALFIIPIPSLGPFILFYVLYIVSYGESL